MNTHPLRQTETTLHLKHSSQTLIMWSLRLCFMIMCFLPVHPSYVCPASTILISHLWYRRVTELHSRLPGWSPVRLCGGGARGREGEEFEPLWRAEETHTRKCTDFTFTPAGHFKASLRRTRADPPVSPGSQAVCLQSCCRTWSRTSRWTSP